MRAEAGAFPLDASTIFIVGRSLTRQFMEKLGRQPRFITGRDTRESGAWIEKAFCAGALVKGAKCVSAEIITTPGVAFLTRKFNFDAGVVVSASHNPFQDNGIKIFLPSGKKIDAATERQIEADVFESSKFSESNGTKVENSASDFSIDSINAAEMQGAYLNYLAREFETLALDDFKMVIDCANGAATNLAPRLFKKFGARVVAINNRPDGRNINKDCGSLHLEGLQKNVLEQGANFGVAFDGDADRALFVDEKGNLVDGDATLWALANYLKQHEQLFANTVVATVMSNLGLEVALREKNIKLLRTSVGDKYVLEELLKTNSSIGGEQSGHIIFPEKSIVGDGMLTTLFLLQAMRESGKSLSEITSGFTRLPQILVNVKVKDKHPFEEVREIAESAREIEKELGAEGRLLLRYSGTENLARVMIEGKNQAEIERQANYLGEIIQKILN